MGHLIQRYLAKHPAEAAESGDAISGLKTEVEALGHQVSNFRSMMLTAATHNYHKPAVQGSDLTLAVDLNSHNLLVPPPGSYNITPAPFVQPQPGHARQTSPRMNAQPLSSRYSLPATRTNNHIHRPSGLDVVGSRFSAPSGGAHVGNLRPANPSLLSGSVNTANTGNRKNAVNTMNSLPSMSAGAGMNTIKGQTAVLNPKMNTVRTAVPRAVRPLNMSRGPPHENNQQVMGNSQTANAQHNRNNLPLHQNNSPHANRGGTKSRTTPGRSRSPTPKR